MIHSCRLKAIGCKGLVNVDCGGTRRDQIPAEVTPGRAYFKECFGQLAQEGV